MNFGQRPSNDIVRGRPLPQRFQRQHLGALLSEAARQNPKVPQLFWSNGVFTPTTLGDLEDRSQRFARALHALGVRKSDCIVIQMPNRLESAVAYRACFLLGAMLAPVVPIYGARELSFILRQSRARVLIIPDRWRNFDYLSHLPDLGDCPDLRHVVVVGGKGSEGALCWDELMAADHDPFPKSTATADDAALLLYTSGTTADPKGVRHSSAGLVAELEQRVEMGDDPCETTFAAWPSGHIGGFSSMMFPHLNAAPSVIMDRWVTEVAVELMAQHRVARSAGVPVILNEMLEHAAATGADLSALRSYMTGAASVPPSIVEHAGVLGIAVFRCYGCTEHPTISSGRPSDPLHIRAHTDGRIMAGSEVRLIDEDERDVTTSGEGEIVSRGAEMFLGYQDAALDEAAFLEGGWYRTGDIGRFEDGALRITDRKKDIIIRGGENISSKEVEDIVAEHPAVLEAAAFAVPHARLGETVCVAVRVKPGAAIDHEEVERHFARAGVAKQKTPERLELVTDFPRTVSGKIKKYELRQMFGGSA